MEINDLIFFKKKKKLFKKFKEFQRGSREFPT
jgi:hypothetical protein